MSTEGMSVIATKRTFQILQPSNWKALEIAQSASVSFICALLV